MARTISTKPKQQKLQKHEQRDHALLSASGASRWINCTPSARLEDEYGEKSTSEFAREGTLAHEIAELYLKLDVLGEIDNEDFEGFISEKMADDKFNDEMLDMVPIYVDYCADEYKAASTESKLAVIEIEQKLDLTEFVPESFGTADCIIIKDEVMEVIDLKYGRGIPVYAQFNKQLMLYGLGALRKYDAIYDITSVKLTIVQPRLNNISTWLISVEDLLKWAETELKPAAELAFNGKGEFKSGEWCRFCSIKNKCRALSNEQLEVAKHDFCDPNILTDEEISEILKKAPLLVEWANSVRDYAEQQAIDNNKVWPGFKLVRSNTKRKWDEETKVANAIYAAFPEADEEDIYDMKLKSISKIEDKFGKKIVAEKLKSVIIKPEGSPTLVFIDDKRPAIGIDEAVNDFK